MVNPLPNTKDSLQKGSGKNKKICIIFLQNHQNEGDASFWGIMGKLYYCAISKPN